MNLHDIEKHVILKSVAGSKLVGLDLPGSDSDHLAVCLEPMELAMGLAEPFEQYVAGPADNAGDYTIYSARKFVRLALKGNPTVMQLLWSPMSSQLCSDSRGRSLQDLAPHFVSRQAGHAFIGYLQAQKQRLLGERGNGGHGGPRPELVAKYGYDTKFAMHTLRLGVQGVELLTTGKMTLPLQSQHRDYLRGVRTGQASLQAVLTHVGELEEELKELIDGASPLSPAPNLKPIEDWLLRTYFYKWSAVMNHPSNWHIPERK